MILQQDFFLSRLGLGLLSGLWAKLSLLSWPVSGPDVEVEVLRIGVLRWMRLRMAGEILWSMLMRVLAMINDIMIYDIILMINDIIIMMNDKK